MTAYDHILSTVPAPDGSDINSTAIDYELDGTQLQGLLVKDHAATGKRPGVLVVHDWLGVNDYVEARATMLARLGYVAFGPDIYGKDVRPDDSAAPGVAAGFYQDLPLMRARASAGLRQLLADPDVDPARIAAIGYCFGGSVCLELARTGADLAGVVSFHGRLMAHDPSDAANVTARLLVLSGGSDPVVPDQDITAWKEELRGAPGVDWQLTSYSGAMHAFTVPTANAPDHGAQYQARADQRSWQAMRDFFDEIFAA